ncbi:MAG: class I adenylate-forming enzyme family protein [Alphaproteobacteria bacterium]
MTGAGQGGPWRGDTLAGHAATRARAPAILTDAETVDWAGFQHRIEAAAAGFLAHGIGVGTPVAQMATSTPDFLVASFALWRIGAGVLSLDPAEPAAQAADLMDRIGARHVVGGTVAGREGQSVPIASDGHADGALPPPPAPESVCVYRRSSGTTAGVSKVVASTHRREQERGQSLAGLMPRTADDRYLAIMTMAHGFSAGSAQRGIMNGGAVILPGRLVTVDDLVGAARRHRATWTALTPFHLRTLLRTPRPEPLLPDVRILVSTAALTAAERIAVMERVSPGLYMSYGANEIGGIVGCGPEDLRRHPETVGRTVEGVDAEAVDDADRPVAPGEVGELRFRHPDFPAAYAAAPPETTSRFKDGWFYPGDLGTIDADGFIFLKGRVDDLVNVGGTKIYPSDVEECLTRHPAVAEAAAFGVATVLRGERLVAAVVLRGPATADALRAHCSAALGAERAPRAILVIDELPRTAMAKPDIRALRALAGARLAQGWDA